jgi:acetyltransferase-like isoleucine patch superfamily enzyme
MSFLKRLLLKFKNLLFKIKNSKRAIFGKNVVLLGIHNIFLEGVDKNIEIGDFVRIQASRKIKIGSNSFVGHNNHILGGVIIGDYFMSGPNVCIVGGNHGIRNINTPMAKQSIMKPKGIEIGNDVWIGANSTVIDGVTIADHCVIGAGSVLTKNTIEWGMYAGNPAKLIKIRV